MLAQQEAADRAGAEIEQGRRCADRRHRQLPPGGVPGLDIARAQAASLHSKAAGTGGTGGAFLVPHRRRDPEMKNRGGEGKKGWKKGMICGAVCQ